MKRGLGLMAWLVGVIALTGCAVGSDYRPPAAPQVTRFTAEPLPAATSGGSTEQDRAQRFLDAAVLPLDWWTLLGSAELDVLVERALRHSPTIAAAQASLRRAQEMVATQSGTFFPSVLAGYSPIRARVPDTTSSPLSSGASVYTLHTAQLSVTYLADVFGGNRRALESLQAQSESQAWQLRAGQLTLAANVVSAALQEASLREQLAATEQLSNMAERQLHLLQAQRRLGAASGGAVLAQEALLRQAEAAAAGQKKQLALQRDLLSVLVGALPVELSAQTLRFSALRLPDVPTGLPAQLIEQRPDVRSAEAQLHSANADVGVAVANMLPQITLSANYGSGAQALAQLFNGGSLLWSAGANLAQPLFQGGSLWHRKRAAEAQFEFTLAQYQITVLGAFQNVADSLEAARYDADQHIATLSQEAAAAASLRIAQRQLELGDISVLTLLNAESAFLQATIARIQAQANRYNDIVAVYQALGGGWGQATPAQPADGTRQR